MKKSLFLVPLCGIALLSCSLSNASIGYEFNSLLSSEDMYYYTGDSIDRTIEIDGEIVSLIPSFFSQKNGEKIEDLSYEEDIKLSGYDLSVPGEQLVTVTCTSNNSIKPTSYYIIVRELEVSYIEVSDVYHSSFGAYKVGDKFEPIQMVNGVKRGLNVTLSYNDPYKESKVYFADDEALTGISYDLSQCKVDENNCFTEAGEFSVSVTYEKCTATYEIKVAE